MSSPVISENVFLLYSLGMGIFITFVYDILRILRRVYVHNNILVSLEDILFWAFCAIAVFYLMHTESNGTLRWFAVLGALVGMFIYKKTVSAFFVKWVSLGLQKLLAWMGKIVRILLKPVRFLTGKSKKAAAKAANKGKKAAGFMKKKLTSSIKLLKIVLCKR
ncbi:MAG: spore cortex biosynthesis protein YabQ [Lachnospiraceae bacterium]|nr:spore cortex biosynthesis protein YabQ [Lachnospiraceae bacterium]